MKIDSVWVRHYFFFFFCVLTRLHLLIYKHKAKNFLLRGRGRSLIEWIEFILFQFQIVSTCWFQRKHRNLNFNFKSILLAEIRQFYISPSALCCFRMRPDEALIVKKEKLNRKYKSENTRILVNFLSQCHIEETNTKSRCKML